MEYTYDEAYGLSRRIETLKITAIKASDAPAPPKKMTAAAQEILASLQSLKSDQVLKIEPDEGQTIRGLKVTFGRIASNNGIKITSYDDGTYVYVKRES